MPVDLVALRLRNQQLVRPRFSQPAEIVSWFGAVQAQDYGGAKWALGQRIPGATAADVERAFDDGRILRTHVLRPTWHFVLPSDLRWLLALTGPRVNAVSASVHRASGLDGRVFARAHHVLERSLEGSQHLTRRELSVALARAGIRASGIRLAYVMMHAELAGVVCSGPRRGKQFTYALVAERAPATADLPRDEALCELTRRYFQSHGPATIRDYAWWSGLTIGDARRGVHMLGGGALAAVRTGGCEYRFAPVRRPPPALRRPALRLLPNYDEYLIAYKDRDLIPPTATSRARDPYPYHVILNGRLAGSWRPALSRREVIVQAALYRRLSNSEARALGAVVTHYGTFTGCPARLESRVLR